MLLKIRDLVSGWIAAVIVGILIIPFALWGVNSYFGQGINALALAIDGTEVTLQEYQRAHQNLRQQWQSLIGGSVPAEQEEALKQRTLDNLIERELLRQVNTSIGVRVSNTQVAEAIKNLEPFQGLDGFDSVIYEQSIAQLGYSPAGFEEQMRQDMTSMQLQSALVNSVFVTKAEAQNIAMLKEQIRDISYATLSTDALKDDLEINDEQINAYYDQQGQQFMEPERVRIAYVDLSLQKIAGDIEVNEDDISSYYEANKQNYDIEEQRKFEQLFISTGENASEEVLTRAKDVAQAMYELIKAGATFEEAKQQVDTDAVVTVELSEHDFMTRGIMEPEVDEVMFNLTEGDVGEPIVSASGVQIIRVVKVKGGVANTFENVREEVEQEYRQSLAEKEYFELADQLTALAFEHPDTLDIVSEELNLTVLETALFSRQWQGNELLRNPKILSTSFSEDVLIGGNNSEPIEVEDNRLIVLRVVEHVVEKKKPLEEVRERIIARLKFEQASELAKKQGNEIIAALREGTGKEDVANQHGFEWKEATGIKRDEAGVDRSILKVAFRLGRPQEEQPVYGGDGLISGDYAVIIVNRVRDADVSGLKDENITPISNQLRRVRATDTWMQFVKSLREEADIQVYSNNL